MKRLWIMLGLVWVTLVSTAPAGSVLQLKATDTFIATHDVPDSTGEAYDSADSVNVTVVYQDGTVALDSIWYNASDAQAVAINDALYLYDTWDDLNGTDGVGVYTVYLRWYDGSGAALAFQETYSVIQTTIALEDIGDTLQAVIDTLQSQDGWVAREATVQIVDDSIDAWDDNIAYLDEAISGLDDNPWDAGTRTLTTADWTTDADLAPIIDSLYAVIDSLQNQDNWVATMPDYWSAADSTGYQGSAAGLDSTAVARAVWNAPSANHVAAATFGKYLDTEISGIGGGSGAYSTTLVAVDTASSQVVTGASVAVRNLDQSALLASGRTGLFGSVTANLDAGSYVITVVAPGYEFASYDTVVVAGSQVDSILGHRFDPGTPSSPGLCRVFGYMFDASGQPEAGTIVAAHLPTGTARVGTIIITPGSVTSTVGSTGYFYIDLVPSALLNDTPEYEIAVSRTDGAVLRKRLTVPNQGSWEITW